MHKTDQPRFDGESRHEVGESIGNGLPHQDCRWFSCLGRNLVATLPGCVLGVKP
jgi:hypothetical protein